jgi:hypothetical protein
LVVSKAREWADGPSPENVLKILKARGDPFLDLALALYGDDDEVLRELWVTNDRAIKRAILCNQNRDRGFRSQDEPPGFLTPKAFGMFLAEADITDLEAFFTNPTFKRDHLSAIFQRSGNYADLPDERWHRIAVIALMNPNLHFESRWDRYAVNGYREYADSRPKSLAFRLLFELPAEQPWAWALESGYSRLPDLDSPTEAPKEVELTTSKGRRKYEVWREKSDREFLQGAFRRWTLQDESDKRALLVPTGSCCLRMALASKVPSYRRELRDWLEKHEDRWVRIGAATTKEFFRPEEVREWYDREGWAFLIAARANPSLHRRSNPAVVAEVRSLLSRSVEAEIQGYGWEDTQFTRSWWSQEAERLYALDPERFLSWDEDPELPSDEAVRETPMLGALRIFEHRLDKICRSSGSEQQPVLNVFAALPKLFSAMDEASRTGEQQLADRFGRELGQLREHVSRLVSRMTVALVLIVIVGIVIAVR